MDALSKFMKQLKGVSGFCAGIFLVGGGLAVGDDRSDFFEAKIRPVLVDTCFRCHGDTKTGGSLRVDSRDALLNGGDSGPAIMIGKPQDSLLIRAMQRHEDISAMPPEKEKALRPEQVRDFSTWVASGAHWPSKTPRFEAAKHWAFQPIRDVAVPDFGDGGPVGTSVDRFLEARRRAIGREAMETADRRTLIRRATYDLTGLPPTAQEVDAFLNDASASAFMKLIDRLLGSPSYGERWGRHWLDVARYADTAGETADFPVPLAWRYRNYVIHSFNVDKPYDQFVREQVAGDLLADQAPREQYAELATATGYLAISRRFGFDSENYHHLTIQDTIDTLGQSVLGLSLGCARCHDHKFDAVSTRDYYGLYGIFESSRYAFPGSEQKQRVRSMLPLVPPSESQARWRDHAVRMAGMTEALAKRNRPVATALLRSLHEMDGDFELQAPASGGSNGVLVPPWVYAGPIAVTTAAQSPYKNLYSGGRVGASITAGQHAYRIAQAIRPRRTVEALGRIHVNLDFRVSAEPAGSEGGHRFSMGVAGAEPALSVVISAKSLSVQTRDGTESLGTLQPNQWCNLQLDVDLKHCTLGGRFHQAGSTAEFASKVMASQTRNAIELVEFCSSGAVGAKYPAIEFDNLGIQDSPIARVSEVAPTGAGIAGDQESAALTERLRQLVGMDGDLELQAGTGPPLTPWNPGPGSVVTLSANAQSPFQNVFSAGRVGLQMPSSATYDGFGQQLANVRAAADGRLFVGFDFRCTNKNVTGRGSWRFYIGHGPGVSAAVELFFNGETLFRRSGDSVEVVAPLISGEWYQVQLALDLKTKHFRGTLASRSSEAPMEGQFATGWDGKIDYTFIDSYGHIGGIRPAIDADNFLVAENRSASLKARTAHVGEGNWEARRTDVAAIRGRIAAFEVDASRMERELSGLLAQGPFAMAYGVTEGTPRNARIQLRGEPDQPGQEVPRGFVKALGNETLPAGTAGSGRLELARWLTRPDNPLTARVMVNRIWQHHFGRGLVKTPNDFGVRGLPPTHPELLDHLASELIRSGWSVKAMHRLIMMSAAYQQSSADRAEGSVARSEQDVTDLYLAFRQRRLSAEEIRDSILAVTGELDRTEATEHPFPSPLGWGYSQHGPFVAVYDHDKRSVFLMTQRLKRHPFLALFDGADPNATTAERPTTTVPTQALFFLNDRFVHRKAEAWAGRVIAVEPAEPKRVELAWRQAIGRLPTALERGEAARFLAAYRIELEDLGSKLCLERSLAAYLRILMSSNEFLHVD